MEPVALREIVNAYGGVRTFAEIIDSKDTTVYSWLSGHRKMKPTTAKYIAGLPIAKKLCKEGKIMLA